MCIVDIFFKTNVKLTLDDVDQICLRNAETYIICYIDIQEMQSYQIFNVSAYDFNNNNCYRELTLYI